MDINETPPYMFSSATVDYFFRWRWWAAWLAFIPVTVGLFVYALTIATSMVAVTVSFFIGILFWTLFEYLMHRFTFHFIATTPRLKHLHYVIHGMHHAYPTDPTRVIFPPFASAAIGILIAFVMYLLLPLTWAMGAFSGFILGYVFYEFMHYATHHIKWKFSWFYKRKRHHLLHHHNGDFRDRNFGVTTSLWDRVFNTYMV